MGEIADGIVKGLYCMQCAGWIDGLSPGYPRNCKDCATEKGNHRGKRETGQRRNRNLRRDTNKA